MTTAEKPLGKITALLADLGLEVTYAYDDLVFVQHCTFLLQFTDKPSTLLAYCNEECTPAEADAVIEQMVATFSEAGFSIIPKGTYALSQNEDDTIDLKFM